MHPRHCQLCPPSATRLDRTLVMLRLSLTRLEIERRPKYGLDPVQHLRHLEQAKCPRIDLVPLQSPIRRWLPHCSYLSLLVMPFSMQQTTLRFVQVKLVLELD